MGSLFESYDPNGSVGGMFAPAYVHGYQPSEDAVAAWNAKNRPLSSAEVEQTRIPQEYQAASPLNFNYGDARGAVDPEALRVAAQGGSYDMSARRAAIAQRIAQNQAAQKAAQAASAQANNPFGPNFASYFTANADPNSPLKGLMTGGGPGIYSGGGSFY